MTAAADDKSAAAAQSGGSPIETSTSPAKDTGAAPADQHKEAMNHFVAGKRHLLVKDISAAVTSLGQACELLSALYGETGYECADAYYYYGKALLEMARAEAGVFGNALDGVPDGEDSDNSQVEDPDKMTEEEREDVEKKVGEALDENYSALAEREKKKRGDSTEESAEGTEEEDGEGEDEEGGEETEEGAEKEAEKADKKEEKEATGKQNGEPDQKESEKGEKEKNGENKSEEDAKDEESVGGADIEDKEGEDKKEQEAEDEEDPSNLQLAWEMLEVAKIAYSKQKEVVKTPEETKILEAKLCETFLTLGEVSLESENYEQAVADITECLNMRKSSLPADSRRIAETYYHLGVALGLHDKFDEAIKNLEDAILVITKRIENLKNKTESVDESKVSDAFYTRESEIAELEALVPEIREKIQDTRDMKIQNLENKEEEETTGFPKAGVDSGSTSSVKPISTISIKRKADSDPASPVKKAHMENGTAPTTNGSS